MQQLKITYEMGGQTIHRTINMPTAWDENKCLDFLHYLCEHQKKRGTHIFLRFLGEWGEK